MCSYTLFDMPGCVNHHWVDAIAPLSFEDWFQAETFFSTQRDKCIKKARDLLGAGMSVAVGTYHRYLIETRSSVLVDINIAPIHPISCVTVRRWTRPKSCPLSCLFPESAARSCHMLHNIRPASCSISPPSLSPACQTYVHMSCVPSFEGQS